MVDEPRTTLQANYDFSQLNEYAIVGVRFFEQVMQRRLAHTLLLHWPSEKKFVPAKDIPDAVVLASADAGEHFHQYLFEMDGILIYVTNRNEDLIWVFAGNDAELFKRVEEKLRAIYPELEEEETEETRVRIAFWYGQQGGGQAYSRMLAVPTWEEVIGNYGAVVQTEVTRLTSAEFRPSHGGQLLLWQGSPGTGKTFAIRALTKAWVKWCDAHYIIDPDLFFNNANYMMQVMLSGNGPFGGEALDENGEPKWKLVILEDCGELLAKDAKARTGQALSRLLNLADGLLGQGLRVLILMTTNEQLDDLHDAVSRPGRAASQIIFPKLSKSEAQTWLDAHEVKFIAREDMSLAELYAELEGFHKKEERKQRRLGFGGAEEDDAPPAVKKAVLGFGHSSVPTQTAPSPGGSGDNPAERQGDFAIPTGPDLKEDAFI